MNDVELVNDAGYGKDPRPSPLQQEWQQKHVLFRIVVKGNTVNDVKKVYPFLCDLYPDPSVLLPPSVTSMGMWADDVKLSQFVQLPLHLWVPEFYFPRQVPFMPCAAEGCKGPATRQRWAPGGPRLIHGMYHAVYLLCQQYKCRQCDTTFMGYDAGAISKLPASVSSKFRFVLTGQEGVTLEVYNRIVDARVTGSNLKKLFEEMQTNRYTRMYETITAYYQHCQEHKTRKDMSTKWYQGRGAPPTFPPMPPKFDRNAYYDYEPLSAHVMSQLFVHYTKQRLELWTRYSQQLTSQRVCFDATFKVAKRVRDTAAHLLWSLMCLDSGCILSQQMITHEKHPDVLPLLEGYARRAVELKQPLPSRVCSDRGKMDHTLIRHSRAFPNAHTNVDNWHFQQLFQKTLNKTNPIWRDVAKQFNESLYTACRDADGRADYTHAEPEDIVAAVEIVIKQYSHPGSSTAVITQYTKNWWADQKPVILNDRVCSHPRGDHTTTEKVSSSPLENFHRQLNRVVRGMVKCSPDTMHGFLLWFMYRWNVGQRVKQKKEPSWHSYDMMLLSGAYQSCVLVVGHREATELWDKKGYHLPPQLATQEKFGLLGHDNVTMEADLAKAAETLTFSQELIDRILFAFAEAVAKISPEITREALANTPQDLPPPPMHSTPLVSSSSSSSSTSTKSPKEESIIRSPVREMPYLEVVLLKQMVRECELSKQLIEEQNWDPLASRYNNLLREYDAQPQLKDTLRTVHRVTGEIVRRAWIRVTKQMEKNAEHELIEYQGRHPLAVKEYKELSPREQEYTTYEDQEIRLLARLHRRHGTAQVSWKGVEAAWQRKYHTEKESGKPMERFPRNDTQLRTRWGVLKGHDKKKKAENEASRANSSLPPSSAPSFASTSSSAAGTELTSSTSSLSQTTLCLSQSTASSQPSATDSIESEWLSPDSPSALSSHSILSSPVSAVSPVQPATTAAPPSGSSFGQAISAMSEAVQGVARSLLFGGTAAASVAPSSDSSSSSPSSFVSFPSSSFAPPSTATSVSSSPSPLPPTFTSSSTSDSTMSDTITSSPKFTRGDKWKPTATDEFNRLRLLYKDKWGYELFMDKWDVVRFGKCNQKRWTEKNRTEKKRDLRLRGGDGNGQADSQSVISRGSGKRRVNLTPKGKNYLAEQQNKKQKMQQFFPVRQE